MDGTVLIADDDRTIRTVLTQALTRAGCKVHATASMVTLLRWVGEGMGDLVITDVVMPDGNGLDALPRIADARPDLPVIVISAQNTIMTAIRAEERGVFDYLPKPFDLPDLLKRVSRALAARGRAAPDNPASGAGAGPQDDLPLVGRTPAMQALYRLVARVLNADLPVLLLGESGTGKSLIARALHDFSDRRGAAFVQAGTADLGDDGAAAVLRARLLAGSGTLLVEEVGDLDDAAQARLVRLLDALPSGAPRVVVTSQTDPAAGLETGRVRRDLYFRLSGVILEVPPLRSRADDIPLLAGHFLARAERAGLPVRRFSAPALDALRGFSWPGNVRQLDNIVRRLLVTGSDPEIAAAEIAQVLDGQPASGPAQGQGGANGGEERLSGSVSRHLRRYFELHDGALPPPGLYTRILREVEAPLIEIALDATGGNQAKCADLLGINRNTLRKKITDLDIQVTRRRKLM